MIALNGSVAGHIQVGCSTASGKYLLPCLIARFRERYPSVRVDVQVSNREVITQRLLEDRVDFGVASRQSDHRDLEYAPFFTDEVILIVPANHPWARTGYIYPDDLLDAPMIMREPSSGTYEVVYQALAANDLPLDMLNVVMVLGNAEAIEMSVEEGIGVGFVSRLAASRGLALGRVAEVTVQGVSLRQELYFMRNRRAPLTRSQNEFWQFVQRNEIYSISSLKLSSVSSPNGSNGAVANSRTPS
jgi:DNA-binding transcriptional LysR family regulator